MGKFEENNKTKLIMSEKILQYYFIKELMISHPNIWR